MVFLPHWPKFRGSMPIDLRLERVEKGLDILGDPHLRLPPVIHAAGTNGKGSTCAFMRAMLEAAGYKVHTYTSPHLLDFNERITLAGKPISDEALYSLMEYCRVRLDERCDVTYFEAITLAALHIFAETPADVLILETGMGGRLDATNVVPNPALTVITPVSLDHTEFLGDSIYAIAGEKAGIMKKDVPCVVSMQPEDAMRRLQEESEVRGAPLFAFEYDWGITPGETESRFYMTTANARIGYDRPVLLPGNHQVVNAAAAAAAAFLLRDRGFPELTDTAIEQGVARASWPGRLQTLDKGVVPARLPAGWTVLLDGAHNVSGALAVADYLSTLPADVPVYLAAGQTRGRDRKAFLTPFQGKVAYVFGTSVFTEPSAYHGDLITEAAQSLGIASASYDSFEDVLTHISDHPDTYPPGILLCCGSLYLLSDVLRLNKGQAIY